MNSKPGSFQLENSVPGTFLMQGALGGMLGGYVAALIAAIAWRGDFAMNLNLTPVAISMGAIIGVIKATVMWVVVRWTGIQYRALTRVIVTVILAFLSIAVIGRQIGVDEKFLRGTLIWSLSVGIPVALLVGSRVKPWKLFTFGSVASGAIDQRSVLRNDLAILGTLPLRFMSIIAIALLLLYLSTAFTKAYNFDEVLALALLLNVVGLYFLLSAYVTFRTPRKIVLFLLGVILNFPLILISVISVRKFFRHRWSEEPMVIVVICGLFVVAWVIFVIARLSVRTSSGSLNINNQKPVERVSNLDHECLGSRFAEWQQRVA